MGKLGPLMGKLGPCTPIPVEDPIPIPVELPMPIPVDVPIPIPLFVGADCAGVDLEVGVVRGAGAVRVVGFVFGAVDAVLAVFV
jgi:hypothetical protein